MKEVGKVRDRPQRLNEVGVGKESTRQALPDGHCKEPKYH